MSQNNKYNPKHRIIKRDEINPKSFPHVKVIEGMLSERHAFRSKPLTLPTSCEKDNNTSEIVDNLEEGILVDITPINIIKFLGTEGEGQLHLGQVMTRCNFADKDAKTKIQKLSDEVKLVKGFDHPNIVKYLTFHRSSINKINGILEYNIIMEYMESGSLSDIAKNHERRYHKSEIQEILRQILNGLGYLHSNNIIHRDIKPANILVDKKGTTFKITDFSISARVDSRTPEVVREYVGTPWYMAPEVILGSSYSYAADIWSLGCLAFELFTGRRPYDCYEGIDTLYQMVNNSSPLATCPTSLLDTLHSIENRDFFDFLNKCCEREPSQRPTAKDLINHQFLNNEEITRKKSAKEKLPKIGGRRVVNSRMRKLTPHVDHH